MNLPQAARQLTVLTALPIALMLTACGSGDAVTGAWSDGTTAATTKGGSNEQVGSVDSTVANAGSGASTGADGGRTGCPATHARVPSGAATAQVADLDGDGERDEIWLFGAGDRHTLGVRTASGAVTSTTFRRTDLTPAEAVANRLGDGSVVVLLDTGATALLYTVSDCAIVATRNVDGQQYTFDLGITGYGTGVGCPGGADERYLAGYNAMDPARSGTATVLRTRIDLSGDGTSATNGAQTDLGDHDSGSALYRTANRVSCGGSATVTEPQD